MATKAGTKQAHPKAAKPASRKRGAPGKVAARTAKPASRRKAAEPPKVDPAELRARLEQLRATRDELAEDVRDETAPIDVDLLRAVQATDPALSLLPDEAARLAAAEAAEASEKGYDPDVPLERRTQKEKDATMLAHNAASSGDADAKAKARTARKASGKKAGGKRGPSRFDRMVEVLRASDRPMSVKEIVAAIPDAFVGVPPESYVMRAYAPLHAGIAKGVTVKVGPSAFDLKELNPRASYKRPAKK